MLLFNDIMMCFWLGLRSSGDTSSHSTGIPIWRYDLCSLKLQWLLYIHAIMMQGALEGAHNVAGLGTTTDWMLNLPLSFGTAQSSGIYRCGLGGYS